MIQIYFRSFPKKFHLKFSSKLKIKLIKQMFKYLLVDYIQVKTHILRNGALINMNQVLDCFGSSLPLENQQFCFPPENRIKAKGPNFSKIPYYLFNCPLLQLFAMSHMDMLSLLDDINNGFLCQVKQIRSSVQTSFCF